MGNKFTTDKLDRLGVKYVSQKSSQVAVIIDNSQENVISNEIKLKLQQQIKELQKNKNNYIETKNWKFIPVLFEYHQIEKKYLIKS